MKLKIDVVCGHCGKKLKWDLDATYTDQTLVDIEVRPCTRCLKAAKIKAHTEGMIERDRQIEKARKREKKK